MSRAILTAWIGSSPTAIVVCLIVAAAVLVALVWRRAWQSLADGIGYAWALARLSVLDRIAGPLPATEADDAREHARDRLRQAFPEVDIDGAGPPGTRRQ